MAITRLPIDPVSGEVRAKRLPHTCVHRGAPAEGLLGAILGAVGAWIRWAVAPQSEVGFVVGSLVGGLIAGVVGSSFA